MRNKYKLILLIFLVIELFPRNGIPECLDNNDKLRKDFNVILVIIDTLRADHLSCYGYNRKTSPAIDNIAKNSFIFENAFSQAGFTLASVMSIFTSLYPKSHGMLEVLKDKLSTRVYTIAEILKIYDYKTAWFSLLHDPHLDIDYGFGRGFDCTDTLGIRPSKHTNRILSWLEQNKYSKFFLAMDIRSVHEPFFPAPRYKNNFLKGEKGKIIETEEELSSAVYYAIIDLLHDSRGNIHSFLDKEVISSNKELFDGNYEEKKLYKIEQLLPPEKGYKLAQIRQEVYFSRIEKNNRDNLNYLVSLYDACILEVDQELIKPLILKLKELKLYDNTILIITADHGEEFGEHGNIGHGVRFYDELIHVPLIIRVPYLNKRRRIKELVQSIDIMPTALELLGIPLPYYTQGTSLVSMMKSKRIEAVHEYVYGQNNVSSYLRSIGWKLITDCGHPVPELYNLNKDPQEKENLYYVDLEIRNKLDRKIREWETSLPAYKEEEHSFLPEIDTETQEKIKKTGYW